MKKVEKVEFLNDLVSYAKNEISLKHLLNKYETDYRTMHNKITNLAETYPDIYKMIVENHPYSEKQRKDINFKALMIEIMKSGMPVRDVTKKYGISERTLQRRVEKFSKTDPDFVKLYRKCTNNSKTGKKNSGIIKEKLSKLEYGEVIINGINEDREKQLLNLKIEFDKLVESGISKNEAAQKLGLTSSNDAYKKLKELERIQKEKAIREEVTNFKERMKVDIKNNENKDIRSNNNEEISDKEFEER